MKKIILSLMALSLFVFAARVRTGAIAEDITVWNSGGGINTTGTNILIGYLPPKSAISSVTILPWQKFNATTNNYLNLFVVYTGYITNVIWTQTNIIVENHDVGVDNLVAVAISNTAYPIFNSTGSTAVYGNYEQNGAVAATNGKARVIVNYIQY